MPIYYFRECRTRLPPHTYLDMCVGGYGICLNRQAGIYIVSSSPSRTAKAEWNGG